MEGDSGGWSRQRLGMISLGLHGLEFTSPKGVEQR